MAYGIGFVGMVKVALRCLLPFVFAITAASPLHADEIDAAFAELAAAVAEEKALVEETAASPLQRLDFGLLDQSAPAPSPKATALAGVEAQLATLAATDTSMGPEEQQWRNEQALLESWSEVFSAAVGHLTPRQFAVLNEEAATLRDPGFPATPFRSLNDVRSRIVALGNRISAAVQANAAERARVAAEIDRLQDEREALELEVNAEPVPIDTATLRRFAEDALTLEARDRALDAARQKILAIADRIVALLARQGPPYLVSVKASDATTVYYEATWEPDESGTGDVSQRLARLKADRLKLTDEISQLIAVREEMRADRQYLAERMSAEAERITAAAEEWGDSKFNGILYVAIADAVMSVAEVWLTGPRAGVAKAGELADAMEKLIGARTAGRAATELAANPLLGAAPRLLASNVARKEAQVAVNKVFDALKDDFVEREVQAGASKAFAELAAERELAPLRNQLAQNLANQWDRLTANPSVMASQMALFEAVVRESERGGARWAQLVGTPRGLRSLVAFLSEEAAGGPGAKFAADRISKLYDDQLSQTLGTGGEFVPKSRDWAASLIGDGVETGLKTVVYAAGGSEGITRNVLSRMRAGGLTGAWNNVKDGFSNRNGNIITVASIAVKAAIAGYFDVKTNAAADRFWSAFAASTVYQQEYNQLIEFDWLAVTELRKLEAALKAVEAEIELLNADRTKHVVTDAPLTDPNTPLKLDFTFSTGLTSPPELRFGETVMTMKPVDTLPSQKWTANQLACYLETGALVVELSGADTPFAALDSDPRKPARKPAGDTQWRDYEAGPDTNHRLLLGYAGQPEASQHPLGGCWIGMGGFLVVQPGPGSASAWRGITGHSKPIEELQLTETGLTGVHYGFDGAKSSAVKLDIQPGGRFLAGEETNLRPVPDGAPKSIPLLFGRQYEEYKVELTKRLGATAR